MCGDYLISNITRETICLIGILGQQTNLKCVKRGEPLDQETLEWIGMCSVCWVWRRLPENYFPQYVNELTCDSDVRCLSGTKCFEENH